MELTRRGFLGGSAALAAAAAAGAAAVGSAESVAAACSVVYATTPEAVAMSRLSYGPSPAAVAAYRALGASEPARYEAWVRQQLSPAAIPDSECEQRLAATRLKIRYQRSDGSWVSELRGLETLGAEVTAEALWASRVAPDGMAFDERRRPYNEVRVATWIRAVYSRRQLFELLVDFWHNHFNVKADSDQAISALWPIYDRIMRTHALGNFRAFVEAVGRSVAMMYYLDNASNKAGGGEGGNENYARELFELHTLGSDNYLKFYDDRGKIETISHGGQTYPLGYIDDDIYEASRCLTGWTIANGRDGRPDTGSFFYKGDWHDTYPKTVLAPRPLPDIAPAPNIPSNQPELKDGRDVFDLVCYHPGTARHLCTKLARRFIADDPPKAVIDAAVAVWLANRTAPDQIKKVLEVILLSAECRTSFGQKIKRPLEAIWSYLRAVNASLPSDAAEVGGDAGQGGYWGSLFWNVDSSGHRLFGWDTPTGHPDKAEYWANTNGILARWNMPYELTQSWGGNIGVDVVGQTPAGASCSQIVDYWLGRLVGFGVVPAVRGALVSFLAQGGDPNGPPQLLRGAPDWGDPEALSDRIRALVQLIAATPEFSLR